MRQRRLMDDAEACEALGELGGDHRRAVVTHECAWQAALLDRLCEPMHQLLGGLVPVPLDVTGESRVVIDDAEQQRCHPGPRGRQHLLRTVMEVEVPQTVHVLGLEAAHLALLEPCRGRSPGARP